MLDRGEGVARPDWPLASVVIPAHNEGEAVAQAVNALLADALPGEFEVAIVANGCTDNTREIASHAVRQTGHQAHVLELAIASKAAALNAGDDALSVFPRLYLDADVLCPTKTARAMATAARESDLVVPSRTMDLADGSWITRAYYRTWLELPRVGAALSGRGAYMLSEAGRRRFDRFPDVVADDYWTEQQLPAEAACIVDEAVTVRPPGRALDMFRVRTRVYAANSEVQVETGRHTLTVGDDLRAVAASPAQWPGAVIYVIVTGLAKVRGKIGHRPRTLAADRDPSRGIAP